MQRRPRLNLHVRCLDLVSDTSSICILQDKIERLFLKPAVCISALRAPQDLSTRRPDFGDELRICVPHNKFQDHSSPRCAVRPFSSLKFFGPLGEGYRGITHRDTGPNADTRRFAVTHCVFRLWGCTVRDVPLLYSQVVHRSLSCVKRVLLPVYAGEVVATLLGGEEEAGSEVDLVVGVVGGRSEKRGAPPPNQTKHMNFAMCDHKNYSTHTRKSSSAHEHKNSS